MMGLQGAGQQPLTSAATPPPQVQYCQENNLPIPPHLIPAPKKKVGGGTLVMMIHSTLWGVHLHSS